MVDPLFRAYTAPEQPLWKSLLKVSAYLFLAVAGAMLINWTLDLLHLDPFGIREIQW